MQSRRFHARTILSVFLALVFFVAALPGTMAMPAVSQAHAVMAHTVKANAGMSACCDHAKPQKAPESPCKDMKVCAGLLGCFGIAALAVEQPRLPAPALTVRMSFHTTAPSGTTHPPDTPPPIA